MQRLDKREIEKQHYFLIDFPLFTQPDDVFPKGIFSDAHRIFAAGFFQDAFAVIFHGSLTQMQVAGYFLCGKFPEQ